MNIEILESDYKLYYSNAQDFSKTLVEQIGRILIEENISLGVPIESRVKDFKSIIGKLERKEVILQKVIDLDDFIGLRIILLFKRDLDLVTNCLKRTFNILHEEDKLQKLAEDRFGYQSRHYILKIPNDWLKIPTFKNFGNFKAEIQVRTLSQHIWAATSHKLQYKHEKSVPLQLRRAMNRASAVLEVVDLEFERILSERESYISIIDANSEELTNEDLNVDNLKLIAKRYLPIKNHEENDHFDELITELIFNNITTVKQLVDILEQELPETLKSDQLRVEDIKDKIHRGENVSDYTTRPERVLNGAFYTQVGLIRISAKRYIGKGKYVVLGKKN